MNKLRLTLEQVADAREARDTLARGIVDTKDATREARRMFRAAMKSIRNDVLAAVPLSGTPGQISAQLTGALTKSLAKLAARGSPGGRA